MNEETALVLIILLIIIGISFNNWLNVHYEKPECEHVMEIENENN